MAGYSARFPFELDYRHLLSSVPKCSEKARLQEITEKVARNISSIRVRLFAVGLFQLTGRDADVERFQEMRTKALFGLRCPLEAFGLLSCDLC
ncbi:hypothetical protein AVEN_206573-1 [Araneus ventricosus]|uniref:Uncharacterized protein n=1 Tax=Araneus ventricosus TaxID=182803 RepID=A0A4Y2M5P2_ARAVE|nr:hypothetical protein AVEN_206573-1 [Araneus ventricosus]